MLQDSEVGCFGMAEAFGYDKEHTAFSRQIAAQNLLPRLAKVPRCLCSSQRFFLPPPAQNLEDIARVINYERHHHDP